MSELEKRLAGLDALPVAPLPGAAAARSRGEQRTRRTRAVLASAGALVAVLALSAGVALGGGGTERIPPPADQGPSTEPQTSLSALLVDVEAVQKVRGEPEWQVRTREDMPFAPMPSGCRDDVTVFGEDGDSALHFLDGPGDLLIGHQLRAWPTSSAAQGAFGRLIDSLEECEGATTEMFGGLPGSGPGRFYGRYVQADFAVAFSIEQLGPYLSGVALRSPRPDDRLEELPPLADVAGGHVRVKLAENDPRPVEPAVEDGLLRPEDLTGVGAGSWQVMKLDDPELGGLSDCQRSALDPSVPLYPEVGAWARITTDGHAGSLVQQETRRYPDADAAARSFDLHVEAVHACRTEEILDWPAETKSVLSVATHEVVEQSDGLVLVRTTYACATCEGAASHLAVLRVGPWLTVLSMSAERSADFIEVARARLRAAG
jgi:hypothetical protein